MRRFANVYVVAGPNGSGKTTFAREFLPDCRGKTNMKKRLSIQDKAELAMKAAVKKVIAEHKKTGRPLSIWKNGRAVHVPINNF